MAQKQISMDALKLVGGGLVGAGLALLLAPQSGKQARRIIARYAHSLGNKSNVIYDFTHTMTELIDTVGSKASDILSSGEQISDEAKGALLVALEKGQQRLERQKQKLAKMMG